MEALNVFLYLICTTVRLLCGFLEVAMLLRAILSWIVPPGEENLLSRLLFAVTEPVILPVRALLGLLGLSSEGPIDFSFFITAILLMLLNSFLPVITL